MHKKQQRTDGGKKKDTVVEMVNMGLPEMQEQIGNSPGHDQDYQNARGDEGEKQRGECKARQTAQRHALGRGGVCSAACWRLRGVRMIQNFSRYRSSADSGTAFSAA